MNAASDAQIIRDAICDYVPEGREVGDALAALDALVAERDRLHAALERIEANETVLGGAGVIRGDAALIAREALAGSGGDTTNG